MKLARLASERFQAALPSVVMSTKAPDAGVVAMDLAAILHWELVVDDIGEADRVSLGANSAERVSTAISGGAAIPLGVIAPKTG